jgi:hypothetical protein
MFFRQESSFLYFLSCTSNLKLLNLFAFFILLAEKNCFESDFGPRILACSYKTIKNDDSLCIILYFFLPCHNNPPPLSPVGRGVLVV